ncbi:MAG: insulinase family protein, partial [bacterium]|nr:insulinase family protein [bacterium]
MTPDFGVQIPQKYTKTDVIILENGLKLYSYKLANGHKVTIIPMENSPAMVKNYVNVGSMNETDDIKGISHFLEHMAFNGTNGTEGYIKLNRGDSFKKVDEMGGWTNASTNYALTDYVNSTPLLDDNDLEKQIQIIASMTEDLKLSEDMVEKEKFPVCSEIDMILDSPETIAIDQTVRSLFNIRSSSDELVGGSVNHIQNLNRQKILEYYNKYYTPDNMHLVITGNVNPEKTMQIVAKNFHSTKSPIGKRFDEKITPIKTNVRKDFVTNKTSSANITIGFSGQSSNDVKSTIISELVSQYINMTDFGMSDELQKLNAVRYFGTEKISTNPNNPVFKYIQINNVINISGVTLSICEYEPGKKDKSKVAKLAGILPT